MKLSLTLTLFLFSIFCFGQREASNWLFGKNVGLRFTNNGVIPQFGELNTLEGCASISDENGNLLFYSDGSNVWTRNHQLMPNGTNLLGDESSTQSAIIVPNPKESNIYYLFTVGSTIVPTGFNYYTIDLNLNNGFGDVLSGPVNLTDGHGGNEWSEKITAVEGGVCNTYWVISLVNDLFYSYKVDESGVDPTPVISQVDFFSKKSRGYLKVSPDGTKLAAAHQGEDILYHGAFLYSFNRNTGEVSNDGIDLFPNEITQAYGVEFSPQATKLYISTIYRDSKYDLYQFDLTSNNIVQSKTLIHSEEGVYRGGLQLGIDGKIYVTIPKEYTVGTRYIDAINNPEEKGEACNFELDQIDLGNDNFSMQGLPPFIQSFFYSSRINIVDPSEIIEIGKIDFSLCNNDSFTLKGPIIDGAEYFWTYRNVTLPTPSPPNELVINKMGDNVGGYYKLVVLTNDECDTELIGEANISYTDPPEINKEASIFECDFFDDNPTDNITTFDLKQSFSEIVNLPSNFEIFFYLDDSDAIADTGNLNSLPELFTNSTSPQTITTKVYSKGSKCYSLGKLEIFVNMGEQLTTSNHFDCDYGSTSHLIDLNDKKESIILENNLTIDTEILFYESLDDALSNTNSINGIYELFEKEKLIYFKVKNSSLCASGTFKLIINPLPPIGTIDETITICESSFPYILSTSISDNEIDNYNFKWSNGQTENQIEIQDGNSVSVTVTDKLTLCQTTKTFTFDVKLNPVISAVEIDINSRTVNVITNSTNVEYQFALDEIENSLQKENIFLDVEPGIHTVFVKNPCGITEKKIYLLGFPKFFTPNADNHNDYWSVKGLDTEEFTISSINIFNRYGKLLTSLTPNSSWNGTYNGKILPSDDYWFSVGLKDRNGKVTNYSGHFSLLR